MLKVNFRCQKYVKKGYMGMMTKKIYLEPQKSALGRSIIHYSLKMFSKFEIYQNVFIYKGRIFESRLNCFKPFFKWSPQYIRNILEVIISAFNVIF